MTKVYIINREIKTIYIKILLSLYENILISVPVWRMTKGERHGGFIPSIQQQQNKKNIKKKKKRKKKREEGTSRRKEVIRFKREDTRWNTSRLWRVGQLDPYFSFAFFFFFTLVFLFLSISSLLFLIYADYSSFCVCVCWSWLVCELRRIKYHVRRRTTLCRSVMFLMFWLMQRNHNRTKQQALSARQYKTFKLPSRVRNIAL